MSTHRIPPYLPFSSFLTALDQLGQALPTVITKDVFPHHSGLLQNKVLSALRFFELIDDRGVPKGDRLEKLVTQREMSLRRANLRQLLKAGYSHIIKMDLAKVTPSQLDSAFSDYGISGDTKKKAKTFFLQGAKFAELPLSPLLAKRGRRVLTSKKRKAAIVTAPAHEELIDNRQPRASKIVELKSGATLTVTVTGNLLELETSDHELLYAIMDQIRSYQSGG